MMTFSFIIPIKPGGYIAALESLRSIEASSDQYEILVAEGCSPSKQRNTAVNYARGDILYFLDDDSLVAPDCLDTCASIMSATSVAVCGGPSLTPPGDSRLQQLFGLALSSIFGAGGMRNRYRSTGTVRETTDKELILCNLAIKRDVFLKMNGLDERLYPNEENELLDRIQSSGEKLIHAPHMAIHRSQRKTAHLFIRQMFSYGRGRAQQTLISRTGSIIGFVPLFFLIYLALLPVTLIVPQYLIPLWIYTALATYFTIATMVSSSTLSAGWLLFFFPLMHISNGYGLLYGLVFGKSNTSSTNTGKNISIRKVKEFGQHGW